MSTKVIRATAKNSPILVVGAGSIGQRHYRNLRTLGFTSVAVFDIDRNKIPEGGEVVTALTPEILKGFRAVFICNPTQLHVETALMAIKAGAHVFIEKPLSHDGKGLTKLLQAHLVANKKNKQVVMVGCNFRFHPGFLLLSELLRTKKLGKPLSLNVHVGHDLSASRVGADYRKTYAADPRKGGGVIVDSGSHVVDYLISLFGPVERVTTSYGNVSSLKIASEDYAVATLRFKNVFATMVLDYFSKPKRHRVEVECEEGSIVWDFPENYVEWYDAKTGKRERREYYLGESKDHARNDMYLREIEYFLMLIDKKVKPVSDLPHAVFVTKTLLAIKKSGKQYK